MGDMTTCGASLARHNAQKAPADNGGRPLLATAPVMAADNDYEGTSCGHAMIVTPIKLEQEERKVCSRTGSGCDDPRIGGGAWRRGRR